MNNTGSIEHEYANDHVYEPTLCLTCAQQELDALRGDLAPILTDSIERIIRIINGAVQATGELTLTGQIAIERLEKLSQADFTDAYSVGYTQACRELRIFIKSDTPPEDHTAFMLEMWLNERLKEVPDEN